MTGAGVVQAYGLQRRDPPPPRRRHRRTQYRAQMGAAKWFAVDVPARRPLRRPGPGRRHRRRRVLGPGLGPRRRHAGRLPVPREPAPAPRSPSSARSSTRPRPPSPAGARSSACSTTPIDVVEPEPGVVLPAGRADGRPRRASRSRTETGDPVLRGIDLHLAGRRQRRGRRRDGFGQDDAAPSCSAGSPTRRRARSRVGGVDLRDVSRRRRARSAIRMVPQDGFLFDTTLARERAASAAPTPPTTRCGPPSTRSASAGGSTTCPAGSTTAGRRARRRTSSVGERQLVALARAQLGDPGPADPRRGDLARSTPRPSRRSPRPWTAWPPAAPS